MTEKHGGQPEKQPDKIQDMINLVNMKERERIMKLREGDKEKKIEKIESLENTPESDDKMMIGHLINIHDENDASNYTLMELKKILKKFPNLREEIINKIEDRIEEEKNPNKIKSLEELKNKIPKK
jgi:hypothetical protein